MSDPAPVEPQTFDVAALGVAKLNQTLRQLPESDQPIIVSGCAGQLGLCTGLPMRAS